MTCAGVRDTVAQKLLTVTATYRKKKKGNSSYKYSQAMKDAKKTYKHKAKGRK